MDRLKDIPDGWFDKCLFRRTDLSDDLTIHSIICFVEANDKFEAQRLASGYLELVLSALVVADGQHYSVKITEIEVNDENIDSTKIITKENIELWGDRLLVDEEKRYMIKLVFDKSKREWWLSKIKESDDDELSNFIHLFCQGARLGDSRLIDVSYLCFFKIIEGFIRNRFGKEFRQFMKISGNNEKSTKKKRWGNLLLFVGDKSGYFDEMQKHCKDGNRMCLQFSRHIPKTEAEIEKMVEERVKKDMENIRLRVSELCEYRDHFVAHYNIEKNSQIWPVYNQCGKLAHYLLEKYAEGIITFKEISNIYHLGENQIEENIESFFTKILI